MPTEQSIFKDGTIIYVRKKAKGKEGMSVRAVCDLIQNEFKVDIFSWMIQKKVKEGMIGVLPLQCGPKVNIRSIISRICALPLRFTFVVPNGKGLTDC